MAKSFPWQVSNEDTHVYYKVVCNGVSHCFTDSYDAVAFAKQVNGNVFEVTDTIFHRAVENPVRKCHLQAKTTQYTPKYYVDGSLDDILKAVSDCYEDGNVREIKIFF